MKGGREGEREREGFAFNIPTHQHISTLTQGSSVGFRVGASLPSNDSRKSVMLSF